MRLAGGPVARFDRWMAEHPLAYGGLVLLTTVVVLMVFVDLPLAVYLRSSGWALVRPALNIIGELGRAEGWVAGAILLYLLCLWKARAGAMTAAWWASLGRYCLLLLAGLAATGAMIHPLKALVGRSRPSAFFDGGHYGLGRIAEGYPWDSFPSGHTQVAVTVATVLLLLMPRLRVPIVAAAALVALSRLVTGAHYLSDVLVSAVLCSLIVLVLARFFLDQERRWLDQPPWRWWAAWTGGSKRSG